MSVTVKSIEKAAKKLKGVAKDTPLQLNKRLSEKYEAEIYIKREDLQEVRSFKIRGAYNKISNLSEAEKRQGIACASAGNHAQGVALSCTAEKIKGVIFMPETTPNQKIQKVKKFGDGYIEVELYGSTYDEACERAQEYADKNNAVFVHAFNDEEVISGQGTIGKEVYEALDGELDFLVCPIGGGGLISGVSTYLKGKSEDITVIGCEPDGAPSMYTSVKQGKIVGLEGIDPFADGVAVAKVGEKTFSLVKEHVDKIFTVPEGKICTTMIELYQNEGIVAEPAGALPISALDEIATFIKGKRVVCVLSGGNNDVLRYPEVLEKSLVYEGLKHYFVINFAQKPGQLKKFVTKALGPDDDIARFEYIKKTNKEKGPALVGIELSKREDYEPLLERMAKNDIQYQVITSDDMLYKYLV